jgi:homoserine kinase
MGSSAAASVGGVYAGHILGGGRLTVAEKLRLATALEGHPDNASAALLGGFVVSAHLGERVEAVRFDAPDGLRAVLFIPDRRLSTADMRRVLPAEVPLRDAVSNMSRIAIGVAGIASGRFELLADLTVDRIHEPYRSVAYPQLPRLTGAARAAGALGAFLSGAGSTVLAFVAPGADAGPVERALADAAAAVDLTGRIQTVSPRNRGPEATGER